MATLRGDITTRRLCSLRGEGELTGKVGARQLSPDQRQLPQWMLHRVEQNARAEGQVRRAKEAVVHAPESGVPAARKDTARQ